MGHGKHFFEVLTRLERRMGKQLEAIDRTTRPWLTVLASMAYLLQIGIAAYMLVYLSRNAWVINTRNDLAFIAPSHLASLLWLVLLTGLFQVFVLMIRPQRSRAAGAWLVVTTLTTTVLALSALYAYRVAGPTAVSRRFSTNVILNTPRAVAWATLINQAEGYAVATNQEVVSTRLLSSAQPHATREGDVIRIVMSLPANPKQVQHLSSLQSLAASLVSPETCTSVWNGLKQYLYLRGNIDPVIRMREEIMTQFKIDGKPYDGILPPCGKTVTLEIPAHENNLRKST